MPSLTSSAQNNAAQDVLDFWFSENVEKHWFVRSDDLDEEIKQHFSALYEQAHSGTLDVWGDELHSALALTIILDQFPRNMFRGSGRAFESDAKARQIAKAAIEKGFDQQVSEKQRAFFYLPLMHSEDLNDQKKSVELYEALGNANSLDYAHQHLDIIAQFGRFPHRNVALKRENTPEETEFLKTHSGF
ncbi:DUF924 family protein [Paenochrobactrum pullorum]|uniref:DUF924 family protein n=1 Tax=Paenochrobactrum pullorum TaxID=1324351 RepID=UPI0035BC283B